MNSGDGNGTSSFYIYIYLFHVQSQSACTRDAYKNEEKQKQSNTIVFVLERMHFKQKTDRQMYKEEQILLNIGEKMKESDDEFLMKFQQSNFDNQL